MTELIEVLVIPLRDRVNHLVVHVLAIDDQIVVSVEDEVPRLNQQVCHLVYSIKLCSELRFALNKLIDQIVDNMSEVLSGAQHLIEGLVLELVDESSEPFPSVFRVAKALSSMRYLRLD